MENSSNQYCVFELITPRIQTMRVILVDNLIAAEEQYSEAAHREPGFHAGKWVRLERMIAGMAMSNIENNVRKLIRQPEVRIVHLSDLNEQTVREFDPDAIVLSGTLRDFDLYSPDLIAGFNQFIKQTRVPVMAICGIARTGSCALKVKPSANEFCSRKPLVIDPLRAYFKRFCFFMIETLIL